jgi:DNA-binding transcriptional regulator GbsR (MarR family)
MQSAAVSQLVSSRSSSTTFTAVQGTSRFHGVEDRFIENWAQLAESIGMDKCLGSLHAVLYLGSGPLSARACAEYLNLDTDECVTHLQTLVAFGGVHEELSASGETVYVAERDPWSWFMATIRERARREFSPLIASIRAVNTLAQEAKSAQSVRLDPERSARIERISRFTCFIDQISGLVETFSSLGAAPLMATMRMASRFIR